MNWQKFFLVTSVLVAQLLSLSCESPDVEYVELDLDISPPDPIKDEEDFQKRLETRREEDRNAREIISKVCDVERMEREVISIGENGAPAQDGWPQRYVLFRIEKDAFTAHYGYESRAIRGGGVVVKFDKMDCRKIYERFTQ